MLVRNSTLFASPRRLRVSTRVFPFRVKKPRVFPLRETILCTLDFTVGIVLTRAAELSRNVITMAYTKFLEEFLETSNTYEIIISRGRAGEGKITLASRLKNE